MLFQQAKALLGPLRQQWEQSAAALLNRGQASGGRVAGREVEQRSSSSVSLAGLLAGIVLRPCPLICTPRCSLRTLNPQTSRPLAAWQHCSDSAHPPPARCTPHPTPTPHFISSRTCPLQDWEAQGALSALYLSALRELLQLLPDWEGVEADMEAFLRDGAQAAAACVAVLFTGPPGAGVSFGPGSSSSKVLNNQNTSSQNVPASTFGKACSWCLLIRRACVGLSEPRAPDGRVHRYSLPHAPA